MSITEQQIKLYQSEVLADTDDGGGHMTGHEVVDGQLNNLFPDISRLDRVYGRVSLRKGFLDVITTDNATYYGAHAIITDPPADTGISVSMMSTGSASDQRTAAVAQIEQYLVAGAQTLMTPFNTQLQGQREIIVYTDQSYPSPAIGDTYVLSIEGAGDAQLGTEQYVRVSAYTRTDRTFVDNSGSYTKSIINIEITAPLLYNFPGADVQRLSSSTVSSTRVRETNVAPGTRYYSISALAEDVNAGDTKLTVASIFTHLIPSATSETALLDQQIAGDATAPQIGGPPLSESAVTKVTSAGAVFFKTLRSIYPKSLTLNLAGTVPCAFVDNGDGTMKHSGGGNTTATVQINYVTGQITCVGLTDGAYAPSFVYQPCSFTDDITNTKGQQITQGSQGLVYTDTLLPKPAPGALQITYAALGRWYRLQDQGNGLITSDAGAGSGTIDYTNGTFSITLAALPDIGTYLLYAWGTTVDHYGLTATHSVKKRNANIGLNVGTQVVPSSVVLTYTDPASNSVVSLTDDGNGNLSAAGTSASGQINYINGDVYFATGSTLASAGLSIHVACNRYTTTPPTAPAAEPFITETPDPSLTSYTVADGPIKPGSLTLTVNYSVPTFTGQTATQVVDDGNGNLLMASGYNTATNPSGAGVMCKGAVVGSVNYTSGVITPNTSIPNGWHDVWTYNNTTGVWSAGATRTLNLYSIGSVSYKNGVSAAPTPAVTTITPYSGNALVAGPAPSFDLSEFVLQPVLDGSLMFSFNGITYYDRGGALYYLDGTGTEQPGGLINYTNGLASLSAWNAGGLSLTLLSLVTGFGAHPLTSVIWRVNGSPVREGSYQLTYALGGAPMSATSDNSGAIAGTGITSGTIDYVTGIYQLTFSPSTTSLSGGSIGVSQLTRTNGLTSASFNAVITTYLPLDASLLGLDPVRLPLDGRVPFIASGDVLVIHNTQTTTLTNPVSPGVAYSLGRGRLSYAHVLDANGLILPTSMYTEDLDGGSVMFNAPLDLSAYVQPLEVEHRIEDMVLCSDAQIGGQVTIIGTISHAFPANTSYLSSALTFGDLVSRVANFFSQATWTNVWQNTPIGDATTGQFNKVAYPPAINNQGAITESWRLQFTSTTNFQIIGETVGQIGTGDTGDDLAPINPSTGQPYFSINHLGWGSGWSAGNVVRFNTLACGAPIWFIRTTLAGPQVDPTDDWRVQLRGDSN